MTHLWEANHAYYCEAQGYYGGTPDEFGTWQAFVNHVSDDVSEWLLFRWDWYEAGEGDGEPFTGDIYYRNGQIRMNFMGQRKGCYWSAIVSVCRADEGRVREFLQPRLDHLKTLWAPLT